MPTPTPASTLDSDSTDYLTKTAQHFYDYGTQLRHSTLGLPQDQADPILEKAQEATEGGEAFTALAISSILDSIKPDLDNIEKVTGEACDQLKHLTTVSDLVSDGILLLAVGTAAASQNPAAIIAAVQALADSLTGTTPASSSSSSSGSSKS